MSLFGAKEHMYKCESCGAAVVDTAAHLQFHQSLLAFIECVDELATKTKMIADGVQRNYIRRGQE